MPAFARATGWLAEALRAERRGDRRRLLAACGRGSGSSRSTWPRWARPSCGAHATAHGAELAGLAQRAALRSGRLRLLLTWSERWRAVTLGSLVHPAAVAPAHPAAVAPAIDPVNPTSLTEPADPTDQAERAALRDVTVRLERANPAASRPPCCSASGSASKPRSAAAPGAAAHARLTPPAPDPPPSPRTPFDAGVLLGALGPARLLELVVVDGDLHVLACGGGRTAGLAAGASRRPPARWISPGSG